MKQTIYFAAILSSIMLFIGCNEEEEARSSITITAEDIPYVDGKILSYTNFELSEVVDVGIPYGEDQLWDFSKFTTLSSFNATPYQSFDDASLPGANFASEGTMYNSLSGTLNASLFIREHNSDGIYRRSNRLLQDETVSILEGAGELVFKSGDQVYSNGGDPLYLFPATYGDERSHISTVSSDFEVTLTSAGLDHTPANTLDSVYTDIVVSGWGRIKLPGYDKEFEVITQLVDRFYVRYFYLGGQLAPDDLLAGLGLSQSMYSTETIITFITPEHGIIAAAGLSGTELNFAYFRNDLPKK